ncbi:MAG: methylated-DNA--[protein]-cysteine S-methyltransferase [Acidobacteriota bacterium]|nr:methylated-DNA--[protein]-cysteine S-methyltransferase [Acidobacteriota bacterium]
MLSWIPFPINHDCRLAIVAGDNGIQQIRFDGLPPEDSIRDDAHPALLAAAEQLRSYFAGELRTFDLQLDARGTPFQRQVWRELQRIPYGETRSYADIANAIESPKAVRAVGAANGKNPLPIVVPCHRVIGSDGSLVGFGGGMEMKKLLLNLENESARRAAEATA